MLGILREIPDREKLSADDLLLSIFQASGKNADQTFFTG
jgi:hypothetical protein